MTIDREHILFRSRCLPEEKELREVIESTRILDPYNVKEFTSHDQLISRNQQQNTKAKEDYIKSEEKKTVDRLEDDYIEGKEKEELEPAILLPDFTELCPALSYRDDSLKRSFVPQSPIANKVTRSYYSCNDSKSQIADVFGGHASEDIVSNVWPAEFKEKIDKSCDGGSLLICLKLQRCNELKWSVISKYESFLNNIQSLQRLLLVEELRKQKHIRCLGEPDLRSEIRLRKKQYPSQEITVMLGTKLEEYYTHVYNQSLLENGVLVGCPRAYTGYPTPPSYEFGEYESAVVAKSQIRASHSFEFAYGIARATRAWNIAIGMFMEFALEVTPRQEEISNVDPRQLTLF